MSNDLLKEAIADAKAVRETALANAKIALEEAFTPKLQSMLSAKIQNEAEEIEEEEIEETEETTPYAGEQDLATEEEEAEASMEEDEEATEEPAEELPTEEETEEVPAEDDGTPEEGTYEGEEEEVTEDEEEVEEDLELEAIIRELEDEIEEDEEEAPVEEVSDASDIGAGDNKVDAADSGDVEDPASVSKPDDLTEEEEETVEESEEETVEEEVDLEEIIRSLQEEDEEEAVAESEDGMEGESEVVETLKSDLKEAYDVVRFLKGKINEVNLLNGKLLFTNKLFKAYSLSEGQKLKVIETFDRAKNIREVKLVYSTLAESMNSTVGSSRSTKRISEGMASKPTASTKPSKTKILNEGDVMADRFKKLAGLIN